MHCNHLGLIFKVLIRNNAVGRGEFCDKIGLDFGAGAPSLTGSSTEPGCPNALGLEEGEEEEEEGGSIGLPLLSRPELHVGDPLPQPIFGLAVRQTLSLQGLLLGVWGPLGWGLFLGGKCSALPGICRVHWCGRRGAGLAVVTPQPLGGRKAPGGDLWVGLRLDSSHPLLAGCLSWCVSPFCYLALGSQQMEA